MLIQVKITKEELIEHYKISLKEKGFKVKDLRPNIDYIIEDFQGLIGEIETE